MSLEVGPASAPEFREVGWVVKGGATRCSDDNREVVRAQCGARGHIHRELEVLGYHDV